MTINNIIVTCCYLLLFYVVLLFQWFYREVLNLWQNVFDQHVTVAD